MWPAALLILTFLLASCGAPPRGDVTITMKSGEIRHGRLLAVENNEAIARLEPWGDMSHTNLDSIASVERRGAVSPLAVIAGGVIGTAIGSCVAAVMYNNWTASHKPVADPRSVDATIVQPPGLLDIFAFSAIISGTALGIWGGTFIHKPSTSLMRDDSTFVARLRSLSLFPNGLQRVASDSSAENR